MDAPTRIGIAGGMYAFGFLPPGSAGSFRGCAPRLEHQGPGCALSIPARVLAALRAAPCRDCDP